MSVQELSSKAIARGQVIYDTYRPLGTHASFDQITDEEIAAIGGRQKFLDMFTNFYTKMFADERMRVLFDMRHSDVNVPPEDHGRRLGLFMLARFAGDTEYRMLRGNVFSRLGEAHHRARGCPMRTAAHQGRQFTLAQRNTWLGYQEQVLIEAGADAKFQAKMLKLYAGYAMPFIEAGKAWLKDD